MGSMYMCGELLSNALTTTAYRDFWTFGDQDPGSGDKSPRPSRGDGVRTHREKVLQDSVIVCCSTENCGPEGGYFTETPDSDDSMVGHTAFSRLDPATLKYIGWAPSDLESQDHPGDIPEAVKNDQNYENLCRLSKVEFKKLTDQVRDVNMNLRNKFRTSAYQIFTTKDNIEPLYLALFVSFLQALANIHDVLQVISSQGTYNLYYKNTLHVDSLYPKCLQGEEL
uniref:Uncharacterized protein n=1 Tax=Magallana gigas TaxID=29159 RepID=A0A8W8JU71_MAGGI